MPAALNKEERVNYKLDALKLPFLYVWLDKGNPKMIATSYKFSTDYKV
jgi:hypothetical protein